MLATHRFSVTLITNKGRDYHRKIYTIQLPRRHNIKNAPTPFDLFSVEVMVRYENGTAIRHNNTNGNPRLAIYRITQRDWVQGSLLSDIIAALFFFLMLMRTSRLIHWIWRCMKDNCMYVRCNEWVWMNQTRSRINPNWKKYELRSVMT